jgi:F1F0 ATPase subunit 2
MDETLQLLLAFVAGGVLGVIFFGGLWWTIRKGITSKLPALWFFGSLLVRMSVTLLGFYFVAGHRWERMLSCFLGFVVARLAVTWLTRPSKEHQSRPVLEASHAP